MTPAQLRELSAIADDFNNFKGGPMPIENISPDIEKIKADGARGALLVAINNATFAIEGLASDSRKAAVIVDAPATTKESLRDFAFCMTRIKAEVAKAEAFYAEWKRLG